MIQKEKYTFIIIFTTPSDSFHLFNSFCPSNPIRLCDPARGIVTKAVHKTLRVKRMMGWVSRGDKVWGIQGVVGSTSVAFQISFDRPVAKTLAVSFFRFSIVILFPELPGTL